MQNFYVEKEVTVYKRELVDEEKTKEFISKTLQALLTKLGSPYKVCNVSLSHYPEVIMVTAVDRQDSEPDEDNLGLDCEGFIQVCDLKDSLAQITGAGRVSFPYWYWSK